MNVPTDAQPKRCAHQECNCLTDNISGFCSTFCQDAEAAPGDLQEVCRCGRRKASHNVVLQRFPALCLQSYSHPIMSVLRDKPG